MFIDIDASLANRLNDRPQHVDDEFTGIQQQGYKPVLKCPKCGNDMIVKDRKNNDGKFLGCVGFPGCKNIAWLSGSIQSIEVLDESCQTVKKLLHLMIKILLIIYNIIISYKHFTFTFVFSVDLTLKN